MELDPENVQGLHNLCVVFVERGELAKAEHCLIKAHHMAPNEDYIKRHLKIVRARIHRQNLQSTSNTERRVKSGSEPTNPSQHKPIS